MFWFIVFVAIAVTVILIVVRGMSDKKWQAVYQQGMAELRTSFRDNYAANKKIMGVWPMRGMSLRDDTRRLLLLDFARRQPLEFRPDGTFVGSSAVVSIGGDIRQKVAGLYNVEGDKLQLYYRVLDGVTNKEAGKIHAAKYSILELTNDTLVMQFSLEYQSTFDKARDF